MPSEISLSAKAAVRRYHSSMQQPNYIILFTLGSDTHTTADALPVELWRLAKTEDPAILSDWARHLREHYIRHDHIDKLRGNESRRDYLLSMKFPDPKQYPGPIVRSGDITEMIVADLLEWKKDYWVPRLRWSGKATRHDSMKGSDVLGFHLVYDQNPDVEDELFVVECKAQLTGKVSGNLQNAINDSVKDPIRLYESLNYLKQRFISEGRNEEAEKLERFQKLPDTPFRIAYGVAAVYSADNFTEADLTSADATKIPVKKGNGLRQHPNRDDLKIMAIISEDLMERIHSLYELAAAEA